MDDTYPNKFIDQLGHIVSLKNEPNRIISLVPSQTELLFSLNLEAKIIGVTKFCIHPKQKVALCAKVGGTKKLNMDKIRALQPDLIIGNKEENTKSEIEILQKEFPVWMSDINNLQEAMEAIFKIGSMLNREPEAVYLNSLIHTGYSDLQRLSSPIASVGLRTIYLIWQNPYIAVGKHTFIDNMLKINGLNNVVAEDRYPEITISSLINLNPQLVLLSSEPYPFGDKHMAQLQKKMPNAKIILVDGEMFSWYGSRLVQALSYFFDFQQALQDIIKNQSKN